jgi:hypothetical protein
MVASPPSKVNIWIVLDSLKNFSNLYAKLSPQDKAALLQCIIQDVTVSEDKVDIRISFLPSQPPLTSSKNHISWLPE